ncbi:hypothetical protein C2G38_2196014 [Gigaspora rosea]|uniref:Phosphatidylglycerol/phosphatidylinositol transfer protein n=1 Tax=Gigaspora rosea TaxID=44941 RepID=A0A397UWX1_9GLOM|nr:hypothetical protein C2G38_2196014 [Gigaspora rosea]
MAIVPILSGSSIKLILLLIFMIFINPSNSDNLSGFVKCNGTFPIEITHWTWSPYPSIANNPLEFEIGGTSTVTIEEGANYVSMVYLNNQLVAIHIQDFCKGWVEQSGGHCPVSPGKFYYKRNTIAVSLQQLELNNVTVTHFARVTSMYSF